MRKVLIGLGLAGALALGFGKMTTARADDTPAPSQESQRAADKAEGAANSAGDQADKAANSAEGAAKGAEDQADKATNSAGDSAKAASDKAMNESEKANIPRDKAKGSLHE